MASPGREHGGDDLMIDVRKLRLFNEMATAGADTVADHLGQLAGLDAAATLTKTNFLDVADIKAHVGGASRIGISLELREPPHGHILFLVDAHSAKRLAGRLVGGMGATADEGFSDMERSAIREVGNIMTSAFIDGWANVLETTIDISTPSFTFGPGGDIVDGLVRPGYDLALLVDSRIRAADADIDLAVYMFPDLRELVALIRRLDA